MSKKIINAAQTLLIARETVNEVASIVAETLGPAGKPILIQREGQEFDGTPLKPHSTKDGVTVAKAIQFRDPAKETICRRIIEASSNTVNSAGDGTTTTMVLLQAIFNEGVNYLEKGVNSAKLFKELNDAANEVIDLIDQEFKQEVTLDSIKEVAMIACNGDIEIADAVATAMIHTGENGYCKVEDGYTRETFIEQVDGAAYMTGWSSFGPHGYWLVNNKATNRCELSDPAIAVFAGKLENVSDIEHIIKIANTDPKQMKPILVICNDLSDDVREYILRLRSSASYPIGCVKGVRDGTPNSKTQTMEDIAVMTGTKCAAKGILEIKELTTHSLGQAERIEISRGEMVIFTNNLFEEDVQDRIAELKEQEEHAEYEFDKEHLRIRIAKLSSSLAIIRVGGSSEAEIMEKKDRVDDALCSAKAAIQEGICPGGGYTLYRIAQKLDESTLAKKILKRALEAPIRKIISNAGESPDRVLATLPEGKGYDAFNKQPVDLMQSGIIDAVKVVKSAVINSVSVGGMLLIGGGSIVSDLGDENGMPNPLAALGAMQNGQ